MIAWIIDDGPLETLAVVVDHSSIASWPTDLFRVADATAKDASGDRKALIDAHPTVFRRFSLMVPSAAADILYDHLRQPSTSDKNLAEHQSIAWAMDQCPDAVLVARDKRAAFLALAELGRAGAAHPTELWLYLLREKFITKDEFDRLCARTSKGEQCPVPLRCQNL